MFNNYFYKVKEPHLMGTMVRSCKPPRESLGQVMAQCIPGLPGCWPKRKSII